MATDPGSPETCPSCGAHLAGAYCPDCGERRRSREDLTLRALAGQLATALTSVDNKLLRSFRALFFRPGHLSSEWSRGARKGWMGPVQIFLLANVLYFVLQPLTGVGGIATSLESHVHRQPYSALAARMVDSELARRGVAFEDYAQLFDATSARWSRALVFLFALFFVPIFAGIQRGSRRLLVEHVVFTLHFAGVFLLGGMLVGGGAMNALLHAWLATGRTVPPGLAEAIVSVPTLVALATWLTFAHRRFYGNALRGALLRALAVVALVILPLLGYRFVVFLVTYRLV